MFVVIWYAQHEPARVYGLFETEADAHQWAQMEGITECGDAYDVNEVQEK